MYFTQRGTAEMKKLTSGASGQMFSLCRRSRENARSVRRNQLGRRQEKSCIFISLFFLVAPLMEARAAAGRPAVFSTSRLSRRLRRNAGRPVVLGSTITLHFRVCFHFCLRAPVALDSSDSLLHCCDRLCKMWALLVKQVNQSITASD